MNEYQVLQASIQGRTGSRSMGLKLIVVAFLALLMMIPALFVWVERLSHRFQGKPLEVEPARETGPPASEPTATTVPAPGGGR